MKSSLYLLLFISSLSLFSCQKESEEELTATYFLEDDLQNKEAQDTETATFERRMQWASFIAAKALLRSNLGQAELISLINNVENSVTLKEVLIENAAPYFKEEFYLLLIEYLQEDLHLPKFEKDKPRRPIYGGCRGELDPNQLSNKARAYVNYLADENCTEFYFPLGLSDISIKTFISTAHPLTLKDFNTGYERYHDLVIIEGEETFTNEIIVSPLNITTPLSNIVVTRPFRVPLQNVCDYGEYPGIEFSDFLNN